MIPKKTTKLKNKNSPLNVEILGQVFTPEDVVKYMLGLRKNNGSILEPSCGKGAFSSLLKDEPGLVAIEFDPEICPDYALNMDFFEYESEKKFNTIIGNPPYVKYSDIYQSTKDKLNHRIFDKRTNLYLFFIEKCLHLLAEGGELIFITPRDFLKATSSKKLNELIFKLGTITDYVDLGDSTVFKGYSPNCVIFRFEKDNFSRITNKNKYFECIDGLLYFSQDPSISSAKLGDFFDIRVGAVSGLDDLFEHEDGVDFVNSKTASTGDLKKMLYPGDTPHPSLLAHKDLLINRKIKKFNETNWWDWGRKITVTASPRIYVNSKTRNPAPFFKNSCSYYDGSVLALFPKNENWDLDLLVKGLNLLDWEDLGFFCDGRFLFTQRSLHFCKLPSNFFEKYVKRKISKPRTPKLLRN